MTRAPPDCRCTGRCRQKEILLTGRATTGNLWSVGVVGTFRKMGNGDLAQSQAGSFVHSETRERSQRCQGFRPGEGAGRSFLRLSRSIEMGLGFCRSSSFLNYLFCVIRSVVCQMYRGPLTDLTSNKCFYEKEEKKSPTPMGVLGFLGFLVKAALE